LFGAAAGFASLYLIGRLYRALRGRDGLGGGDPKLLGAIGAWLGLMHIPFVLVGAGLIGLAALLLKRLRGGSVAAADRLPLGALMALAAWPIWILNNG
ncbi:MAG: prepilin peptidase, partial [Allosphingosinicella sp.]